MSPRSGKLLNFLLLVLVLLGLAGSARLHLEENALDLLPGQALRGDLQLLQEMGVVNQVFISLETPTAGPDGAVRPELLASARRVGEGLAASPLFRDVFYRLPEGYEFKLSATLAQYLPDLMGPADRAEIASRLTPARLKDRLHQDFLDLNSPTGLLLSRQIQHDPLNFLGLLLHKLTSLRGRLRLTVQNGYFVSGDGRHCLLWAESVMPLTSSSSAARARVALDKVLAAGLAPGVKARLIGSLPHTLANADTIKRDLTRLLPAALAALVLLLLLILRDWRALLVVAMPFLAAPPAVAFLGLIYPHPSAMALGFGIVLLGIGVDFAIHLYLGCEVIDGRAVVSPPLRRSLLMAAGTTIAVFVVLLFSQVPAHRQMATLAIAGLILALLLAWRLVPLLVSQRPVRAASLPPAFCRLGRRGRWGLPALIVWFMLMAGGVWGWSRLHYSGDLKTLDVPNQQVKSDERDFLATWGTGEEQAFVVAPGRDSGAALDLNDRVYDRLAADRGLTGVQSLSPVLPGPARQAQNRAAWRKFWVTRLPSFRVDLARAATDQGFAYKAFAPFLAGLDRESDELLPELLTDGPLRPFLHALFRKVPKGVGNGWLAVTLVPDDSGHARLLARLPAELPGVKVLSNSRWRRQMDRLLKRDTLRLTTAAALAVLLICLAAFRDFRTMLAVLAPVLAAQAAMALFAGLTGGQLNLMHLLMGIMVIGLSVDYGIFVVTSCREGLAGSTFLAVSLCALSTLSGFGVLAFAVHPALHALGVTVLVGIGAAWPTALLVSPVLAGGGESR